MESPWPWLRGTDRGVELELFVVPKASRSKIVGQHDGRLKIQVAAPPEGGKANAAVVELVSEVTAVRRSAVRVTNGHASRQKRVLLEGANVEDLIVSFRSFVS